MPEEKLRLACPHVIWGSLERLVCPWSACRNARRSAAGQWRPAVRLCHLRGRSSLNPPQGQARGGVVGRDAARCNLRDKGKGAEGFVPGRGRDGVLRSGVACLRLTRHNRAQEVAYRIASQGQLPQLHAGRHRCSSLAAETLTNFLAQTAGGIETLEAFEPAVTPPTSSICWIAKHKPANAESSNPIDATRSKITSFERFELEKEAQSLVEPGRMSNSSDILRDTKA